MKILIIEDEEFAALRLEKMLLEYDKSIEILAKLQSVEDSVEWLKKNKEPELIFLDIQLEDDISFAIFDKVKVNSQIIFTTAFDEYAIKAFKLKSIDYLLKPINQNELNQAIDKYKNWNFEKKNNIDTEELKKLILSQQNPEYRKRFVITVGETLSHIEVEDIAYFFSTSSITFVVMNNGKQYSVDFSLENLTKQLNPKDFYRINRQFLISLKSIKKVHIFPKSRLKIELNPKSNEEIFVSIDKVPEFKKWMGGE